MSRPAILLVEDTPDDVARIRGALAGDRVGTFELSTVATLEDALAHLDREAPDLVLLDLFLPDSAGVDTFAAVHVRAPAVPVVVLAGAGDRGVAAEAIAAGADDYLMKGRLDGELVLRAVGYAMERCRLRRELERATTTDELTGLFNRRRFEELAEHHLRLALRNGERLILLYVDLDGTKGINETLGRRHGSQAIADVGLVLKHTFRTTDVSARFDGDEFSVLLTSGSADDSGAAAIERLRAGIGSMNAIADRPYALSVSVGASRFDPETPASLHELTEQAARAMFVDRAAQAASRRAS
jgi:diguanylate cyclase (GGDEF)-like protein